MAWTPDGNHLLITVRLVAISGGYVPAPRSRLLLVDASPERLTPLVQLLTLPAEVVAGSYTWAPDGNWVAFLTLAPDVAGRNTFVALCAVDTSAGSNVARCPVCVWGLLTWRRGLQLPRTKCVLGSGDPFAARGGRPVNATIAVSDPRLGDLVFFANTYEPGISHVGIYIGSGLQINAPTTGEVVSVAPMFRGYWGAHYAGARRVRT